MPKTTETKAKKATAKTAEVTEKKTAAKTATKKTATKKPAAKKTVKAKKHVLYVASEAFPFAGTGGLGEVIGSLPVAVNKDKDVEARIIIPLYQSFPQEERANLTFITNITVPVAWRNQYCGLFRYICFCY